MKILESKCKEEEKNQKTKSKPWMFKEYLESKDKMGFTALLYAAYLGKIRILLNLIDHGANVEVTSDKGLNVLHMAAQGNNPNIIVYFCESKYKNQIDINSKDKAGNTPLHWACYNSSEEALSFILKYSPDINASNKIGMTPLHIAVYTEKPSLIKKLIKKGASLTSKDNEGLTPVDLAVKITGVSSRVSNIMFSYEPKRSCLQNFFRFTSHNRDTSKNIDNYIKPSSYLISNIILWIVIFLLQLDHIENRYSALFFFIVFLFLLSFIYMRFSDPGKIAEAPTESWLDLVTKDPPIDIKDLCPFCKVKRERLSRHCVSCGGCIREHNCHCYLIDNCIGKNNFHGYSTFLIIHMILYLYIFYIGFKVFLIPIVIYDPTQFMLPDTFLYKKTSKDVLAIFFMTLAIIVFCWSGVLAVKHIRRAIINKKIKEINSSQ